jgi:uncharacterized protein (DUF1800 family)
MPLYMCQPPTGYKDTADAWVNTGALVNRTNFALQFAGGARRPVGDDPAAGSGARPGARAAGRQANARRSPLGAARVDAGEIVAVALNDDISDATRSTIAKATTPEQMMALTLGSPEFQRR